MSRLATASHAVTIDALDAAVRAAFHLPAAAGFAVAEWDGPRLVRVHCHDADPGVRDLLFEAKHVATLHGATFVPRCGHCEARVDGQCPDPDGHAASYRRSETTLRDRWSS